ncbi:MAG: ABC-ATPase domain-containing protein [Lachnospiraceae bacterium]
MKTSDELKQLLYNIDRKGYPAYKETRGSYRFAKYILYIDHVQGDPFAAPSKLHVEVPKKISGFPERLYDKKYKRIALQDHLTRLFEKQTQKYSFQAKGSGKSGILSVTRCGQEILERSACTVDEKTGNVTVRFEAGFPANGRSINAKELIKILFDFLPECVEHSLIYQKIDKDRTENAVKLSEDQEYIRKSLKKYNLVAFVADGSILPRESGVSGKPMKDAIPFSSPESMKVTLNLPHKGEISGMGIKRGITLIVGGGYHGKSTLLKALEMGVYPHISGDGREYVITDADAVKIRAEDGRSIKHTDISMFISDLPNRKDTKAFYTQDASGSTSQAANVIESIEAGASAFFIDEDTSATNFMVRDELMQQVIHRDMEPITPFIERMGELFEKFGVSTVLVAGSSGAYFQVADRIIQMDRYIPKDITETAKKAALNYPGLQYPQEKAGIPEFFRTPKKNPGVYHKGRIKIKTQGRDGVVLGKEMIDLRYVEQLADSEQLTTLGYMIRLLEEERLDGKASIQKLLDQLCMQIEKEGFPALLGKNANAEKDMPGNLAMPRRMEMFACINRYRGLSL